MVAFLAARITLPLPLPRVTLGNYLTNGIDGLHSSCETLVVTLAR